MSDRGRIRQARRRVSMLFVATVVANFVAMATGTPAAWLSWAPLPPLAALLLTGLYLFVLPYRGAGRRTR